MLCCHGIIMAPADIQYDQLLDADSLVVTRFPLAWDQVISPDSPIIARLEPITKSFGNLNYKKSSNSGSHQTSKLRKTLAYRTVRGRSDCHLHYGKCGSKIESLRGFGSIIGFWGSNMSFQVQHNPVIRYNLGLPVSPRWTTWAI